MNKTYKYMTGHYAVIDGAVRRINVERIQADKDGIEYFLEDLGGFRNITIYPTLEDFEKGGRIIIEEGELEKECELDEQGRLKVWKMENGEPSELWMDDLVVKIGFRCQPILPNGYYLTREECIRHNTWVELQEDGTKVEHKGILEKVRLTPKQMEYVKKVLKPAMRDAEKLGIGLITDWNEFMYAYNTELLGENADWTSNPDDDIHWAEMSELTPVYGGFGVVGENCVLFDK